MKKAEVILHPVRMRILQALVRGERMTAQQLQERLGDVPQATLYRHLKRMLEAGVLAIAEEIPNRGTLEKVYMLPANAARLTSEDIQQATPDDHLTFFMNYLAHLLGEYARYVHHPGSEVVRDGVSYRQYAAYLSDEENLELINKIRELIMKAMENEPNNDRRRRLLSFIDFPEG